jgi:hypothetical protein
VSHVPVALGGRTKKAGVGAGEDKGTPFMTHPASRRPTGSRLGEGDVIPSGFTAWKKVLLKSVTRYLGEQGHRRAGRARPEKGRRAQPIRAQNGSVGRSWVVPTGSPRTPWLGPPGGLRLTLISAHDGFWVIASGSGHSKSVRSSVPSGALDAAHLPLSRLTITEITSKTPSLGREGFL